MRTLATVQVVNAVEPIPNADAIEKVRVRGWWVVVKKGEYRPGDTVVYCEIDSLLPERPEFEFLRAGSFKPQRVDADGAVVLDFNRATNLPCAYTSFTTCPIPPAQNRMQVAIEAGERLPA